MAASHKGLGKGLGSLFGDEAQQENTVSRLNVREIEPNPAQPRRDFDQVSLAELAESIRRNGVISPIANGVGEPVAWLDWTRFPL